VRRRRAWAALALVPLAAACSRGPAAPADLEFWAMGREGEMVRRLVPAFERRTGIRVRVQQIPWSAAHEKLLTAYVGRAMPDVIQAGNTWLPELVALGALERLDERIAASETVRREDYFEGILDTNVVEGGTYGVPWYVDTRVLFYRTDLLRAAGAARPPATWTAWLELMDRIKARDPRRFAILLPLTEWQTPVILALQRGARLLRDGDRFGDFRSPPVREALALYLEIFRRELAPRAGEAQVANLYQDFARGDFAVFVSGPWNIGELGRRLPAELAGRWTTAPMPAPDDLATAPLPDTAAGPGVSPPGGGAPGVSLAGGASLAIVRGSRRTDAAWRWIEYLSEPERHVELHRLTGALPARRSAWRDPALRRNPHAAAFRTQLQHVRPTPKVPEWERIASKVGEHAEAAIRGRAALDDALAALDRDVDAILEKRRWMLARRAGGGGAEGRR
jgi:multiple sugar transport system substrate-binding protein